MKLHEQKSLEGKEPAVIAWFRKLMAIPPKPYQKAAVEYAKQYFVMKVIVPATDFYELRSPGDFNAYSARADQNLAIRTDLTDSSTEDTIIAGVQEFVFPGPEPPRWHAGQTVAWFKSLGAVSANVVFKFTR